MTKATITKTRRPFVKAGTAQSPNVVLAGSASAAAAPALTIQPSRLGRKMLALVAKYDSLMAAAPDDPESYQPIEEMREIASKLDDRPVRSMRDIVDRVIVAVHFSGPMMSHEPEHIMPALAGILALAGLRPSHCCMGGGEEADELAGATRRHKG